MKLKMLQALSDKKKLSVEVSSWSVCLAYDQFVHTLIKSGNLSDGIQTKGKLETRRAAITDVVMFARGDDGGTVFLYNFAALHRLN